MCRWTLAKTPRQPLGSHRRREHSVTFPHRCLLCSRSSTRRRHPDTASARRRRLTARCNVPRHCCAPRCRGRDKSTTRKCLCADHAVVNTDTVPPSCAPGSAATLKCGGVGASRLTGALSSNTTPPATGELTTMTPGSPGLCLRCNRTHTHTHIHVHTLVSMVTFVLTCVPACCAVAHERWQHHAVSVSGFAKFP